MPLNLNQCDKACVSCIKGYKKKHNLIAGQTFDISCDGIPKFSEHINMLGSIPEAQQETALAILDPVTWAAQTLDWHCTDPDGSVWMRRDPEEYNKWREQNPDTNVLGHSRYHRPYQADMLRCSSQFKAFRIGRQAGKTEAIVVSMLYHMFVKPGIPEDEGFKIVVIAPYQAQIDLIFSRLAQLIRSNPVTQNSLRRNVKAPVYTLELFNGSRVMGFTAGTKSGGNADSVRGQHAHMLVFDEADYLSPKDLESALSIITNHPNAGVWMSSTPSGKREKFFQVCSSKEWKEFHFTSRVNPMWDDKKETLFRGTLTDLAFQHEILAEFGEQEEGVFQNVLVQLAKERFNYGDIAHMNTWTYTIGVDWNDTKNGTCIVVLGFDPRRSVFVVVDRHTVSREGWTQTLAMNKVVELNRIWRPICVYIDSGFGGTQWEMLRKFGYDSLADPSKGPAHPDAKLREIVKKYEFGSSIEVYDLFTKQPIKKPAKSFLVESTVRRFEAGDIKFPETDDVLEAQLLGYVVDRVTATGVPVYKANDESCGDHVLDALMCAVIGVTMEVSPLGKPKYSSKISITPYFGEKTDMDIFTGDTVVNHQDPKRKEKEGREKARPTMKRTDGVEQTSLLGREGGLPARNMNDSQVRPWGYPGFMRDEPAPRVRTLSEAVDEAYKRQGLRRSTRKPRRKNI